MANPKKNTPPAPTPAPASNGATVTDGDLQTLQGIATGKLAYVTQELGSNLLQAGYIQLDATQNDGQGGVKALATEDGVKALTAAGMSPGQTAKQPTLNFEIDDYAPPAARIRAATGQSNYPYDKLNVGQSFHIPKTDAKPEPHKSYSSLVAQAKAKYAVPVMADDGKTPIMETVTIKARKGKDGKMTAERSESRPKMNYVRDFSLRAAASDDPRGPGARFVRTK